jgi:hypothetical protein
MNGQYFQKKEADSGQYFVDTASFERSDSLIVLKQLSCFGTTINQKSVPFGNSPS